MCLGSDRFMCRVLYPLSKNMVEESLMHTVELVAVLSEYRGCPGGVDAEKA